MKKSVSMNYSVAIAYMDIFDDYETVNIAELLNDIPTKNSLQVVAHFLAQLHSNERDDSRQIEFIRIWAERIPEEVRVKINLFLVEISHGRNASVNFINNISSLILISRILENWNDLEALPTLTPEQELNLLKSYLYCTQSWTDRQKAPKKISNDDDLVKLLLPIQLPYAEILEFKDFRLQFIKAIYFFRFCEEDEIFRDYLQRFLGQYNLASWQDYILKLLNAYVRKFDIDIPSVLSIESEFPEAIHWFKSMSISRDSFRPNPDFKSIRENPIFEINDNTFLFLNLNFLVDKIFQGVQFDFGKALLESNAEYNGRRIGDFGTFRSIYGDRFSETGLFYKVLECVFERSGYKLLSGEVIKKIIPTGEPDYYVRDKSKIYLFEYKDVILNSTVKHSYNYETIREEIFTKMVENKTGSSKGISQLVNTIKMMINGDFETIDSFDFKKVIVYPIIVCTDFSFSLPGVNYILKKEFRDKIKKAGIVNDSNIRDCVVIDLDLFIKFQDLFRDKRLKLNNCLNEYIEITQSIGNDIRRISTFNMYLHQKTSSIKYDSPKMLIEEVRKILPE